MVTMTKCSESRLAELIDTYGKLVFSICYKITGDYFTAEDITQETFLTVFQKYETFDGSNEKAWICRIATNKSIDFLRSAGRKGVPTEDAFLRESWNREAVRRICAWRRRSRQIWKNDAGVLSLPMMR